MNDTSSAVVRAARELSRRRDTPILTAFHVIGAAGIASAVTAVQVIGADALCNAVTQWPTWHRMANDDDELCNAVAKFLRNNR